jgi:hypothetical protein
MKIVGLFYVLKTFSSTRELQARLTRERGYPLCSSQIPKWIPDSSFLTSGKTVIIC